MGVLTHRLLAGVLLGDPVLEPQHPVLQAEDPLRAPPQIRLQLGQQAAGEPGQVRELEQGPGQSQVADRDQVPGGPGPGLDPPGPGSSGASDPPGSGLSSRQRSCGRTVRFTKGMPVNPESEESSPCSGLSCCCCGPSSSLLVLRHLKPGHSVLREEAEGRGGNPERSPGILDPDWRGGAPREEGGQKHT
ncbi:hypothetical protein KUDE01_015837 [Dissostichus eleginoides]|uniref:Uncharacterized protein n=1 Tax=Dissostichus eleginoides TaxID=100907 RepID=A0AAD9C7L7_DISEL|nr:hypothetical protein KUDE01_015837 [Dissostichus eleginoides]